MRSSSGAGTTLLSYPYQTIPFKVNTDDADKQLGAVISQNNKPIAFLSRILINPKCNYNNTEKELLVIVERLKQLLGIIFVYKINIFSDHKNLVYTETLSEYQRAMRWRLIIEEFWPTVQHISGVDIIVADMLSRLPSTSVKKYELSTKKAQRCTENLFTSSRAENNEYSFPLDILNFQREQQIDLINRNPKLSTYILYQGSGYSKQTLDNADIIYNDRKIYVP